MTTTGDGVRLMGTQGLKLESGDVVAIRAAVKEVIDGVGLRVELWSKTDQYQAWIREDLVIGRLTEAADADEPSVGSYVETESKRPGQGVTVWRRDADDGWVTANREEVGAYPWREIKANAAAWRLLHDGNDD